ncbi:hypothetical protein PV328_004964 [Microctonus aethiopoides]|uniref:Major facilitator superfamily (MFS) profile domain-containing protein n=1 Tax=Microctonus aethiopoides TaxID=144406 RepID=A0AA39KM93_9HYME|nr:hypothetical protein PV328_004964 [Microctonus aethiopoides]
MKRGRRVSLMVTSCFSLIGWLLIYMSTNYEKLVVGRIISGIATGLASVPASVYTAEISVSSWRGTMVTWSSIAIAMGILLVYIIGYFLQGNWQLIALICSVFPATAIILIILSVPESPLWLRDRGRMDEARAVMKKFRGIPKEHGLTLEVENELQNPRHNINIKKHSQLKHLMKQSSLMPFIIMLGYFFFQQFSGIFVIVFYAVDITSEAGIKMDAYLGAILIGLTRLIGSIIVAFASKKWGRRIPSIASGGGMAFFMGILSIYVFLTNRGYTIADGGFTPAICILMYIFMSTIGFLCLPFAMVSEIYPAKVKDILTGFTVCIAYIFSFITVKMYPDMLDLMGKHGVFLFYAIISLVGTIFVIFFLPETKGKSLHDIDHLFSKKNKNITELQTTLEKEKMFPLKDITSGI